MSIAAKLRREFGVDRPGERVKTEDGYTVPYSRVETIRGMFTEATTRELMLAQQQDFVVTHLVAQKGAPVARLRDRLVLPASAEADDEGSYPDGTRVFEVNGVDNPGELDVYTIYRVEERRG